jgi:hypothetical protein
MVADIAMPQDPLKSSDRPSPCSQPTAQAVPQVVKTEVLPFRKNDTGAGRRRPQMILYRMSTLEWAASHP